MSTLKGSERQKMLINYIKEGIVPEGYYVKEDKNGKIQRYLKSFVEFFLISEASEAILYTDKKFKTYLSAFPQYAAKLKDIPFSTFQS